MNSIYIIRQYINILRHLELCSVIFPFLEIFIFLELSNDFSLLLALLAFNIASSAPIPFFINSDILLKLFLS